MAGSKITSGVTPDNSGDKEFVLGGDSSIDDRFFKGDLDEIKVWNRALSTEEISNGFKNNALTTNGQIFHEPYSDSDSDTPPPPTESPGTQTPPPTESPGTQTPPPTESPGTQTPPPTESPGTQTPPPTESPGTQTPPPTESPGTQTPPPTESPGTQTPPPTQSPGTQTPPPTESPGTQTPPPTESPGTQTPPPTESPGTQTPPPTEYTGTQTPPPTEYTDTQTPPPTESPGTQTPPPTESPGTQTPPPTESPGTQTPPPTESPGTQTPPPTEYTGTQTPPPTEYTDTQTPPPTESPGTQTPPPTESPGTQTPPPTESPGTQTPPPTESPGTQTPPPTETLSAQTPPNTESLSTKKLPTTESPGTQTPPSSDTMTGFLLLNTNVINDNNGTKQASNFTINILGTQASPSSFKAAQSPLAQIVEIGQGQYSVQVEGIEGYDTHFKNQCAGFTILNNITICTITLNDLTTTPPPQCPPGQHPAASPHLNQTTQQCVPDPQPINNATGFLILRTNVINDNNGTKQASDFTINILGTQASPSSLKAAQSPLAQIVALKQGQYFVQIVGIEGYDTQFKHECAGFTILNSTKVCTITLNDLSSTTPPPVQDPVAKLVAPLQVQGGQTVVLDGSQSVADTLTITQTAGQPVTLTDIGTFKKQFTAPNGNFQLGFQAIAQKGNKQTTTQVSIQVSTNLPPPTGGVFPVPDIVWFYDSQPSLSKDMVMKGSQLHPTDRVILSSSASGVSSHPIKNGWLEVQSGGGNGRVYWNYHEVPQFSQLPTAGFN